MPNVSAALFVAKSLGKSDVNARSVLDVGSGDFNGSVAPLLKSWKPQKYVGVDIVPGRGVDLICSAENLVAVFSENSFDIVLSIEMLEHAQNWQICISNMKKVCKAGGLLVVTTRSLGYPCHGFPHDFWRFEHDDFAEIFSDFEILNLETDATEPGVFVKVRKPLQWQEKDLSNYMLYGIMTNEKSAKLPDSYRKNSYFKRLRMKQKVKNLSQSGFIKLGKAFSSLLKLR